MSKENKLIKDTALYAIGNFGVKLAVFFMLPIYTAYFTPAEYGIWDVITTTISMVIPFLTFELVSATYRWLLPEKEEQKRVKIFTTGLLSIIRNIIVFDIIIFIIIVFIKISYGWSILILINISVVFSYFQQCCRGLGYNKIFVMSGILNTVFTIGLNLIFMFLLNLRIESFIYSSIISGSIVSYILWRKCEFKKYYRASQYCKKVFKELLRYSIPMIPGAVSWWIMNVSDRYIIIYYLGGAANGMYAVANKIPALIVMLSSVFFLAWKDSAINEFDSEDVEAYNSKIFKYYFRIMTIATIFLIASSRLLVNILVSGDFFIAWKYCGFLLIGALFNTFSQFWGACYHASKQTSALLKTSIVGAGVNILINIILIKYIGLYAAAISTALAFFIMWISRVADSSKKFQIRINYKDIRILFTLLALTLAFSFLENPIIDFILISISILIFVIFHIGFIRVCMKFIKTKIK